MSNDIESTPASPETEKRMRQWTILLTGGGYGLVGDYGHTFPHGGAQHERINVVAEDVCKELSAKIEQLQAEVENCRCRAQGGNTSLEGLTLSAATFEEIAESWDGCENDDVGDIGAALRRDFKRLATQAQSAPKAGVAEVTAETKPGLPDLARLFADAVWSRREVVLSPESCALLHAAMTTPPAPAPVEAAPSKLIERAIVGLRDGWATRADADAALAALGSTWAAPAGHAQAPAELLNADEMAALRRFNETCEDGEGYDVPREMMRRLASIGVIAWKGFSRYEITDFGMRVLDGRATPAASDQARNDALEEAAKICWELQARPDFEPEIQDRMLKIAENKIRALKSAAPGDQAQGEKGGEHE